MKISTIEELERVARRRWQSGGQKFALVYLNNMLEQMSANDIMKGQIQELIKIYKRS